MIYLQMLKATSNEYTIAPEIRISAVAFHSSQGCPCTRRPRSFPPHSVRHSNHVLTSVYVTIHALKSDIVSVMQEIDFGRQQQT